MYKSALFLAFFFSFSAQAQHTDSLFAKASLTAATVYFGYGAQLQHQGKVSLINGTQQVVFNNVALDLDMNSMQISCPENVTILSSLHRKFSISKPLVSKPITLLQQDSLQVLQKKLAVFSNAYSINEDVLHRISALVENNFTRPDKKDISSQELIKLTQYYTEQVKQIRQKLFELQLEKNDISNQISKLNYRMQSELQPNDTERSENKVTGQLIIQVMARSAGPVNFEISYFTRHAGWVPSYDIRVKTIDNTLKIVYKAMVSQTTGLDWDDVKLTLSTSNPNQGTAAPHLTPYFLQVYVPELFRNMNEAISNTNRMPMLQDVVITAEQKPMQKNINNNMASVSDFMQLKESQLNTSFEIDLPYDIPSDGNAYTVTIKDEKILAGYQHIAIPKLDRDAFLMAQLSRWDSLSLLPGQANIIIDNVYLGKSFLDPNVTGDTLNLSLGRDKRIAINRKMIKDYKVNSKGDNKTELFVYEIVVKNNKKQPMSLLLKDQYPISRTKEVEVVLTQAGGAEINIETGQLSWPINLQPGESKKIRFEYQVKYPRSKILQELR